MPVLSEVCQAVAAEWAKAEWLINGSNQECPAGHALADFVTPNANFCCDECDGSVEDGVRMHSCRECDFDLCDGCFQRHGSGSRASHA